MGCASGRAPPSAARQSDSAAPRQLVLACLRTAGADASDVTGSRDLLVSGGELDIAFASFNAYVGVAADRHEAVAAAHALDRQVEVLQQAGHGVVRGKGVFYFDAPLVPRAGARLVEACLAGSAVRATSAMAALAAALPHPQLPALLGRQFIARCRALTGSAGCACVYARATRLFSYGQISGLGRAWTPRRARMVFAGVLATCKPASAVVRL